MATMRNAGIFHRARRWAFGEPDQARRDLQRANSHGAVVLALARHWSIPLMIFFSVGALVTLGQHPLEHNLALWQAGQALAWVELAGLLVTVVFVIGMDFAMIVGSIYVRDARQRGEKLRETWFPVAIVLGVSLLEAGTFIKMVSGYEHPATLMDWGLLVGRGFAAPVIAIFLSLAGPRPITQRDIAYQLQLKAGEGLLNWVTTQVNTGAADASQLFQLFALVNGSSEGQRAWDAQVMEALARLAPASVQAEARQAIEAAERARAQATHDVEQAREDAQRDAGERTVSALLHLMTQGTAPPWLIEQHPELEGLDLANLAGNGRRRAGATSAEREPRNEAERQRRMLKLAGIESPVKAPTGRQGVWVSTSDVVTLTGGRLDPDAAREFVKRLGNGATSGRQCVARFSFVLEDLHQRNLLTDAARDAYESLREVGQVAGGELETSRVTSIGG